jgi:hypothetical protein
VIDADERWVTGDHFGDRHLDDLLHLFVTEIRDCGGPDLKADELHDQLMLYVGIMAVAWLLDVPP